MHVKQGLSLLLLGTALLGGCQTAAHSVPMPAKLKSESDLKALKTVLSDVLKRKTIEFGTGNPLEAAEFSVLPKRRDADVRRVVLPDTFILLKSGGDCLLKNTKTEILTPLDGIHCKPL